MALKKAKAFARIVEQVRRESNDKRYESKPQVRIWEIIHMMHDYQEAVVKANAPRDFEPDSTDPDNAERLRKYRQVQKDITDWKFGVTPLAGRLRILDCRFVMGDEEWRVGNAEWEEKAWKPLHAWVARGYQMLFGGVPNYIPESKLKGWEEEGFEIDNQLLALMGKVMPEDDYPVADKRTFDVHWRNEVCNLREHAIVLAAGTVVMA